MREDGHRLSFSFDNENFTITDNLSNDVVVCVKGDFKAFDIEKDVLITHLSNLSEVLSTVNYKKRLGNRNSLNKYSGHKGILIMERDHFTWDIVQNSKQCFVIEGQGTMIRGFKPVIVLRAVNKALSLVMQRDIMLKPSKDIVRRISDVGVLVWAYNKHSIVCYEKNILGSTMLKCLVDGVYYHMVYVSVSREESRVTLFNQNLRELITYPLDDSILVFYSPDEEAFD